MKVVPMRFLVFLFVAIISLNSLWAEDPSPIQFHKTPDGVEFAIRGEKPAAPAPTLFMFAADMNGTLAYEDNNTIATLLAPKGFLCVSLDVPCHGRDVLSGENAADLGSWKLRIEKGIPLMAEVARKTSRVLDYLIAEKYADPQRLAVSGTSRGGFTAFHCAAAEPRFKYVIGFAPVTHLPTLREFEGTSQNPAVLAYSAIHLADKLSDRSVWIAIGNHDVRVGTDDCIAFYQALIKAAESKRQPVPAELHLLGTIDHRLHAKPTVQYRQTYAPHQQAADWLQAQMELPPQ